MFTSNTAAKYGQGFGYNRVTMDGRVIEESDSIQCAHCNETIFLHQTIFAIGKFRLRLKRSIEWCSSCHQYHCGTDDGIRNCFICTPFMRRVERAEVLCRQRMLLWREADNV